MMKTFLHAAALGCSRAARAARPLLALVCLALTLMLSACAGARATATAAPQPPAQPNPAEDFGVLVMAHGGSPEWNAAVLDAVKPVSQQQPVEVAFGMADATTIAAAVGRLEARGVRRIAVVRLFVSGSSWLERTEQILGVRPGAPTRGETPPGAAGQGGHGHGGHSMAFFRVPSSSTFAISTHGLAEAPEMGPILAERAADLSRDPAKEDVLILAHGPGDDAENQRWIELIAQRAEALHQQKPFRRVEVATLREDWPDKREDAERRIRAFVERAGFEGGRALVIPFRVQGFGPYAEVLHGLDYVSDGQGLLPHSNVTAWIESQIDALRDGPFLPTVG